jgi:hypothetical protein
MSFDLASLDTQTLSESGVAMPIVHPRTRVALLRDDKTPVTLTLLGRHSSTFRELLRRIQEHRAEISGRGQVISGELKEQEDTDTLVVCTVDWTFDTLDGQKFPCTKQNIVKLWNDSRFRWLREAAMNFILSDGNFLPDTSASSEGTRGGNSSSRGRSPAVVALSDKPSAAIG